MEYMDRWIYYVYIYTGFEEAGVEYFVILHILAVLLPMCH